jgi:nicotinamide riboside transporter PnuC
MTWLITIISLVGVVLNIKKQRASFALWLVTNGFWCIYDYSLGAYAQSALFFIYFLLAVWGLWEWKKGGSTCQKQK